MLDVSKWARELFWETIPRARTFIIYDLCNGGDPTRPHGLVEESSAITDIVHKGSKIRFSSRERWAGTEWKRIRPELAIFIEKQHGAAQPITGSMPHGRRIRVRKGGGHDLILATHCCRAH